MVCSRNSVQRTNRLTDQRINGPIEKASYRIACPQLKMSRSSRLRNFRVPSFIVLILHHGPSSILSYIVMKEVIKIQNIFEMKSLLFHFVSFRFRNSLCGSSFLSESLRAIFLPEWFYWISLIAFLYALMLNFWLNSDLFQWTSEIFPNSFFSTIMISWYRVFFRLFNSGGYEVLDT